MKLNKHFLFFIFNFPPSPPPQKKNERDSKSHLVNTKQLKVNFSFLCFVIGAEKKEEVRILKFAGRHAFPCSRRFISLRATGSDLSQNERLVGRRGSLLNEIYVNLFILFIFTEYLLFRATVTVFFKGRLTS